MAGQDLQPTARLALCSAVELLLGAGRVPLAEYAAGSLPHGASPAFAVSMVARQLRIMGLLLILFNACQHTAGAGDEFASPERFAAWLEAAVGAAKALRQSSLHGGA